MPAVDVRFVSRYRLSPTPERETGLLKHCAQARFVWNLAVEQHSHWRLGQALRDFAQAVRNFFGGTHRRPTWRKAGSHEGFRQVAFAVVPEPILAPGNNNVVGVDRGVVVSAALSTGALLSVPGLTPGEQRRLYRLYRKLARCQRGSNRRKDWVEKTSTGLARGFDVINAAHNIAAGRAVTARGALQPLGGAVNREPQLATSAV